MSDAQADGFRAVLEAVQGARRAQARQSALVREALKRMVTSEDFNAAIVVLAETLTDLEELLGQRSNLLSAQLAAILERLS